jgi:eukaryotic-like serine/threonine-protein kinase
MKDLLEFFKNKTVHRHFLYAFGGLLLAVLLTLLFIRVFTRHGQSLSVPNFVGLSIDDVGKLADEKDLDYEVIDSFFVQGEKPGAVLGQSPSAFTKVKAGHTIFLTVNSINPEKVEMPNLIGVSIRQAEAMLQNKGLHIGFKRYRPDIAKDIVLSQAYNHREVRPGTKVMKGASIDLVLGLGLGNGEALTPSVSGLTMASAQEVLSNNYLNFGALIYDNTIQTRLDTLQAVIVRQKPESGTKTSSGTSVDVWFTRGSVSEATDSIN